MEEKRIKMFPVNDSSLKQLKKIHYKNILPIFAPIFKSEKTEFVSIDIIWFNFKNEISKELQIISPQISKMNAMYVVELKDKEKNNLWGYYQPFSGKVYFLYKSLLDNHSACIGKNVQFTLSYSKTLIRDNLFNVVRFSRYFRVKSRMLSLEKILVACEDCTVTKTMYSTEYNLAIRDFYYGNVLSMDIIHHEPMSITN